MPTKIGRSKNENDDRDHDDNGEEEKANSLRTVKKTASTIGRRTEILARPSVHHQNESDGRGDSRGCSLDKENNRK